MISLRALEYLEGGIWKPVLPPEHVMNRDSFWDSLKMGLSLAWATTRREAEVDETNNWYRITPKGAWALRAHRQALQAQQKRGP